MKSLMALLLITAVGVAAEKPNIVLIFADDHLGRNLQAKTPNKE